MQCKKCGTALDSDQAYCHSCGGSVTSASTVASETSQANKPSWTPAKVGAAIGAVVLVLALVSVGGTKQQCVDRRLAIGATSYMAEMSGGVSGDDAQAYLSARLRCPLGLTYSDDLVCPVHGAVSVEDRQRLLETKPSPFGY